MHASVRLVRNSKPQQWWGSGWGFSKPLERETLFFGTHVSHHFVVDILNRVLPWDGWGGRIMATVMATGNADMENAAVELVNPRPDANVVMIGCGPGVGVVASARRASNGMVIGLDSSAVMVESSGE